MMKIYILPVSPGFQPSPLPNVYPPHNKREYGVEQDFLAYLTCHPELVTHDPGEADWHCLPIFWTWYHVRNDCGKRGREPLRQEVAKRIVGPKRTFTICQFDDGPLEYPDEAILFLASRKGKEGIDIPLMSDPHFPPATKPKKRWLASFVGRLETQPMRYDMAQVLGRHDCVDIRDGNWGVPYFVHQMLESYVALCPRGYGGSSFRFYEAMSLGVCPMLIGDIDTRPFKKWIDWDKVSAYAKTPKEAEGLLESTAPSDWLERGERAYEIYHRDLAWRQWCQHVFMELGRMPLETIKWRAISQEKDWGRCYHVFSGIIALKNLRVGVEVGVAYGGHAEAILKGTSVDKLYGVDHYLDWPEGFELMHQSILERLSPFGERYQHINCPSIEAAQSIPGEVDFVYIDAGHSYESVMEDLNAWLPKVRAGGIIGGHDYNNAPGVNRAVDEFFARLGWTVNLEPHTVWWVETP